MATQVVMGFSGSKAIYITISTWMGDHLEDPENATDLYML